MTRNEIINQLAGILEYSQDMAKDSDCADIWQQDIEALRAAIEIIQSL